MSELNSQSVISNTIWIISCKLVKAILTLIVTILTARYLGPTNYGLINYAAGIVAFFTPLMKLGLDSIAVYEIVKNPDKEGETLGTTIICCLFSSVLCIIGIVLFSIIANQGETDTVIVCALYSTLLIFQAVELIQYWFHAKLLAKYSALAMLAAYIVVTTVQTALIISKASVYWFALSHSIDYFVIAIILFHVYFKRGGQGFSFSLSRAEELISVSKYYILSSLMVTIFNNTDRVMLKLMVGNEVTGFYAAAGTCASMSSFIFVAIIDSMRPVIFQAKNNDSTKFENNLIGLYSVIIYFSLSQCLLMTVLAKPLILTIYGTKYISSISVLRLVVWFTTFSYLGIVRNIWILAQNKQKYLWKINLSGALMNVGLNYVLIPYYGAIGASVASVISQLFTNVIIGFIISDIKANNILMIRGLNPKYVFKYSKKIITLLNAKIGLPKR